jgi:hypothetical protein
MWRVSLVDYSKPFRDRHRLAHSLTMCVDASWRSRSPRPPR